MTRQRLLAASLGLGLLTALLVYLYVKAAVGDPEVLDAVPVVVAQEMIRPKTELMARMLVVREVPGAQAHPEALRTLEEGLGRLTRETVLAGEQVLEGRLYAREEKPGLTFVIPPGKRAVSVAVDEVIGVAGFIKPGDRVDVLGTFDEQVVGRTVTVTVLQDVEILAISQRMEDKKPDAVLATTVTLAVSLQEAEKVTLAEERGRLRLALRPAGGQGTEYAAAVNARQLAAGQAGQGLSQVVPGAKPPGTPPASAAGR
jgi:pilus assembly protein CpaB